MYVRDITPGMIVDGAEVLAVTHVNGKVTIATTMETVTTWDDDWIDPEFIAYIDGVTDLPNLPAITEEN
jgi:hypothetical protein